jgi:hypothetical protein
MPKFKFQIKSKFQILKILILNFDIHLTFEIKKFLPYVAKQLSPDIGLAGRFICQDSFGGGED